MSYLVLIKAICWKIGKEGDYCNKIGYDNTIVLPIGGVINEEELFKDNQKNIITL